MTRRAVVDGWTFADPSAVRPLPTLPGEGARALYLAVLESAVLEARAYARDGFAHPAFRAKGQHERAVHAELVAWIDGADAAITLAEACDSCGYDPAVIRAGLHAILTPSLCTPGMGVSPFPLPARAVTHRRAQQPGWIECAQCGVPSPVYDIRRARLCMACGGRTGTYYRARHARRRARAG